MRLRSLATVMAFFFLAAMISHSRVSTMVLGVTPVILSKRGVVAHPAVMNDRKRIDTMVRITMPPRYATQVQLPHNIDWAGSLCRRRNRSAESRHASCRGLGMQ